MSDAEEIIQQYNQALDENKDKIGDWIKSQHNMDTSMKSYLTSLGKAKGSVEGYQSSLLQLTAGQKMAAAAQKALTAALNIGIVMAVSYGISKLVQWFDSLNHAQERAIEAGEEAAEAISKINSNYREQADTVNEVGESYAKLVQGVDQLTGKNKNLSTDDYEEFLGINNRLAEMFPQLVKGYDENGNALLRLNGDAKTITGTLKELLETERALANQEIVEKIPDQFKGVAAAVEQINQKIAQAKSESYFGPGVMFDTDTNQITADLSRTTTAITTVQHELDKLGATYDFFVDRDRQVGIFSNISGISGEELTKLKREMGESLGEMTKTITTQEAAVKKAWNSLNSSLTSWLYTDYEFMALDDAAQAGIQNMLSSIDWSELDISTFNDAGKFIKENLFAIFSDDELGKQLYKLFNLDTSDMSAQEIVAKWDDFIAKVKDTLNLSDDSPLIDILVGFTFDERSAIERLNNAIEGVDGGEGLKDKFSQEAQAIDKFVSELKSNSDIELFLDLVMKGEYDSFEELQKAYFEAKKALENEVYIEIVTENFEKVKGLVSSVTDALGGNRGCFFVCLCFFMKNAGSNGKNPCRDFGQLPHQKTKKKRSCRRISSDHAALLLISKGVRPFFKLMRSKL